jgi:hypothetical protein
MILHYAHAKIYRNVVVNEKWDFFIKKRSQIHIRNSA